MQKVKANIIKIELPTLTLHTHSITITPEIKRANLNDFVERFINTSEDVRLKNYFYNGDKLLILQEKMSEKLEVEMGKTKFEIDIVHLQTVNLNNKMKTANEVEQSTIDIILKPLKAGEFIKSGRNTLITPTSNTAPRDALPIPISNNVEIWQGLFQSVRFLNRGTYLNCDVALGAYYQSVPLMNFINPRMPEGKSLQLLEKILRKVKVETTHLKKNFSFKPFKMTDDSADKLFFEAEETGKISVAQYFSKTYFSLRNSNLPCVIRKRGDNEFYFPIECLKIVGGQRVTGKLDDIQTSDVIKIAAKRPHERFKQIQERMKTFETSGITQKLGLKIDSHFTDVSSKILPPPTLLFSDKRTKDVRDGGWNLMQLKAFRGVKIDRLSVVNCSRLTDRDIERKMSLLIETLRDFNIEILDTNYKITHVRRPLELEKGLDKFSVVILPDTQNGDFYKTAKTVSELFNNSITQCVRMKNFMKMDKGLAANIGLKIALKFGGFSHIINKGLNLFTHETIVFGADVSHPGVGSNAGTLAAVVASMDQHCTKFNTYMNFQEDRQEFIQGLGDIVKKALVDFKARNGNPPKSIIFFRDGIGESQFMKSFTAEVEDIKKACSDLHATYKPKITFIVCQKRHSMRFTTEKSGMERGRPVNSNVAPGTLITDLSTQGYDDFYMVSHKALLGTARPVRYTKLLDENNYGDKLPKFIYDMCHLYGRATKSVSIPAPVYYAHLAASRAKVYSDCNEDKLVDDKKVMFYL